MAILTVNQINTYLKSIISADDNLNNIFVTGEISNLKRHYSGHIYFTLKDEQSEISAVMFKGSAAYLKFNPENGMKVIIRCSVGVYAARGQYQLICDDIQPDGIGVLTIAFEQMKKKLMLEGLFDSSAKKSIPSIPSKIGVITAPDGAAIKDIFSILQRRASYAEIVFAPSAVQGQFASAQISRQLTRLDKENCDVIILGRGGGSIEDLWAFNEESVAYAIFNCKTPVISAVGHETDFTIADFVADLRVPTPSAAAEICATDGHDISYTIDKIVEDNYQNLIRLINLNSSSLAILKKEIESRLPKSKLEIMQHQLDFSSKTIKSNISKIISDIQLNLTSLIENIDTNSPHKILQRGYALVQSVDGKAVKSASQLSKGEEINVIFSDATIKCKVQ